MKKILSLILSVAFVLSAFVGCAPTEQAPTVSNKISLCNFEQFEPDFQLIRVVDGFGSVSVNKDEQFVKEGNVSAKLQPLGDYSAKTRPVMYIPLESKRFDYDYKNLLNYESISMWVYNTEDDYKSMEMGFVTGQNDLYSVTKTFGKNVSLKPGWNRVVYYPDHSLLNISSDVTSYLGFYLSFDHVHSRDVDDAPVYYVDDIVISKAEKTVEVENIVTFDEGEIVDWEKDYQLNVFNLTPTNPALLPEVQVVNGVDVGVTPSSGERMLKVVTKPGEKLNGSYPGFVIVDKVMQMSGFKNITMGDWANWEICFDVYAENTDITLFAEFYGSSNLFQTRKVHGVTAKKGKWVTLRKSFTDFLTVNIEDPGRFVLCYAEDPTPIQKVFYFDNFRFEKVA